MRIVASSRGQEWVDRQNEMNASLDRLGTWVACLDSVAYQLARAGRDFTTSRWLDPPVRQAFGICLDWLELQTGTRTLPHTLPAVVLQEPAATSPAGRSLVARIKSTIGLLAAYDMALGASLSELPGDFEALWSRHLEPWLAAEPVTLREG